MCGNLVYVTRKKRADPKLKTRIKNKVVFGIAAGLLACFFLILIYSFLTASDFNQFMDLTCPEMQEIAESMRSHEWQRDMYHVQCTKDFQP